MAYKSKHAKKTPVLRIVLLVAIILLAAVFCVSGYMVISETISAEKDKSAFNELTEIKKRSAEKGGSGEKSGKPAGPSGTDPSGNETGSPGDDTETSPGDDPGGSETILPAYAELAAMNEDLFGWVTVDGTVLDYPVMFTPKSPEYYLRRGFNKKYSYSGVPFMDAKCPPDGNHYLIYGHNMKNQTMFGTLPSYLKKSYYEEHPVIRFDTLNEEREYQVMAVFRSRAYAKGEKGVFRYYAYANLSDPNRFAEYVENCLKASAYKTGVTAEFGDELITLSTCDYYTDNGRLVVVAKRIK